MARVTRRFFLLSSAALSVGCATRQSDPLLPAAPQVRAPAVGQSWRYAKYNLYTQAPLDDQIDRVAAVNDTVEIASSSEAAKNANAKSKWGAEFLQKYLHAREKPVGPLPSEIQAPWGKIVVDPHWGVVQVYETPIPLWPEQMLSGWETHVNTHYKTPDRQDPLPWRLAMKAHGWEWITVPAGRFNALRITNLINFANADLDRTDSVRRETLWLAPEVGRWVARESAGSYYLEDSAADQPYSENGFRCELLEWS
jgi:hypothetical protein